MKNNKVTNILNNETQKHVSDAITSLQARTAYFLETYKDLDNYSIDELAAIQSKLKKDIDNIKIAESALVKFYEVIRKDKLPQLMDNQDINGVSINNVGRVSIIDDCYASIKSNKKSEAFEWLDDHGHADMITRNVHPSSLKALMKSKIKDGEEIPKDIFSVHEFKYSKITKKK